MKLKNFIATLALSLAMISSISAAPKSEKEIVTRIYDAEIHCESCEAKVMNTLPFKKGIKDVKVDMGSQKVTVIYDATKSSDQIVIESLKGVNVTAKVSATQSADENQTK